VFSPMFLSQFYSFYGRKTNKILYYKEKNLFLISFFYLYICLSYSFISIKCEIFYLSWISNIIFNNINNIINVDFN